MIVSMNRGFGKIFIPMSLIFFFCGIIPVFSQAPRLGTPNLLQQALNKLPAVTVAGNSLQFQFGGEVWIARLNGKDFSAGIIAFQNTNEGVILVLKQTHIWPGAVGSAAGKVANRIPGGGAVGNFLNTAGKIADTVGAIEAPGSDIILEYKAGPQVSLRLLLGSEAAEKIASAQAAGFESSGVVSVASASSQEASGSNQPVSKPPVIAAVPQGPVSDNMVWIQSGTFTMGGSAKESERRNGEGPQRQVTVNSFAIGKYQVTQSEYQAVMGKNPSKFKGDNLPVEMVNWYDAVNYCNKLSEKEGLSPAYAINGTKIDWNENASGYRLPTEAEWEYACRAGTVTAYNTGATISSDTGWYSSNSGSRTHEVGQKPPNGWGLYDMHGNVWEWCWDYWDGFRSMRGGAWNSEGQKLRSAVSRTGSIISPSYINSFVGFRVVRSVVGASEADLVEKSM